VRAAVDLEDGGKAGRDGGRRTADGERRRAGTRRGPETVRL